METEVNFFEGLPRESMLTYAVLFGRQAREHDRYALSSQVADVALIGCLTIEESTEGMYNPTFRIHPKGELLEEESEFVSLLQKNCTSDNGSVALHTLVNSKEFTKDMQTLWKRVVMMHHVNYNKHQPLYNTDPTLSIKWQQARRMLGYLLAIGSVYADPSWQGKVDGLNEIAVAGEVPELLAATTAGRAFGSRVLAARRQMFRLTEADKIDRTTVTTYERVLPLAFLFDDDLKRKWPAFLSKHYDDYPAWLVPARPAKTKRLRQEHIAAMLDAMGRLRFPVRKRRARP